MEILKLAVAIALGMLLLSAAYFIITVILSVIVGIIAWWTDYKGRK